MPRDLLDRELLDALETFECKPLEITTWRVAWRTQDVLRGGPGGRWNPDSFIALYTSLEKNGAVAEVYSLLSKNPVFSSADKLIYKLKVNTQSTLILDDMEKLRSLGLDLPSDTEQNKHRCQMIGEVAYRLDCDSLLVPSLRWNCQNVVLFPDLDDSASIRVVGKPEEINWPAWGKKHAETSRAFTRQLRKKCN